MTTSFLRRPLLCGSLLSLALATAHPPLAQAMEGGGPGRLWLSPAQQQKLFPDWRQLTLQATQRRIMILQNLQQCSSAASSFEALQACQREQRQALISQQQQQREAMRQLLRRLGITPPQPRQDGDRRRMPLQPDGVPMI